MSVISGFAYIWLISNMLVEEIRIHQPERKEEFFLDWSHIANIWGMFEIFLPLTQIGVLGNLH